MTSWTDPAVIAEAAGAVATTLAVGTAVWIAVRSEHHANRRADTDRASFAEAAALDAQRDRQDQWRARMLDLLLRLLDVVLVDQQRVAGTVQPSIQGKALCLALFNERSWIGAAWDVYVDNNHQHYTAVPAAAYYDAMTTQITDAIAQLDSAERLGRDLQ